MTMLAPDPATLLSAFHALGHVGHGVTEVRTLRDGAVVGTGYFDNPELFVRECARANAAGANVHVGIQPRPARVLTLAPNTLCQLSATVKANDIEVVTNLVLDFDPVREPKTAPSTDAELGAAREAAERAAAWLVERGFIAPRVVLSGNGVHLYMALPTLRIAPDTRERIQQNMRALESGVRAAVKGSGVRVDSMHNFAALIRVPGTINQKGQETPGRHRRMCMPDGDFGRREDASLRDHILALATTAASAQASQRRSLPVVSSGVTHARRNPDGTLDLDAPVAMCTPIRQLWEQGHPDRSEGIFSMVRYLAHRDLPYDEIATLIRAYDEHNGGKLVGRSDAEQYILHAYNKIADSRATDGSIAPPCHAVQELGYCRVGRVPGVACELSDPLLDVGAAISAVPDGASAEERHYRLLPIFDALVRHGGGGAEHHLATLRARFQLTSDGIEQALTDARARVAQRRAEQAPTTAPQRLPSATEVATTMPVTGATVASTTVPHAAIPAALDGEITADGANYFAPSREGRRAISSFVLTPMRRITTERGEVIVASATTDLGTSFDDLYLPREAFASRRDLLRHLPSPDMQWTGDDKHVQGLLRALARRTDIVRQQGTAVLGGYGDDANRLWVFPGGAISTAGFVNPPPVFYVPTGNSLDARVRYEPASEEAFAAVARVVFADLARVNLPSVTTPLIGWFFATPLKPWVMRREGAFAVLNVTGTGGTGKTSVLCEVCMPLLGLPDAEPGSVTSTEFPLLRELSSTNSVPIVLDEYKPQDMTQVKIDQIHRYARRIYKGEVEQRGNQDKSVTSYHLTAPLVIAGETRPSDAALLERFITASPAKGTLEAHPACRDAFARLRAVPLHRFAPRYIQFALGRDLDADLAVAAKRTRAVVGDRPLPLRVVANLRVMALGVHLFEEFAEACGMPLAAPLDLAAGVEAVIRDVTGGGAQPRNALDHFVEELAVMAAQRELREGVEFFLSGDLLYVRLELAYNLYRRHLRAAGHRENAVDLSALRRFVRENFAQGGYIAGDPEGDNRIPAHVTPKRYRAIVIDVARAAHLLGGEFQRGPAVAGLFPRLEER